MMSLFILQNLSICSYSLALGSSFFLFLNVLWGVCKKFCDDTGGNSSSTLSHCKSLSLEDWKWIVQFHLNCQVVSWHSHFDAIRKSYINGAISCSNESLWSVTSKEWF